MFTKHTFTPSIRKTHGGSWRSVFRANRGLMFIVSCNVDADVILPRKLELRKDGRVFELEVGRDNRWETLRVTAPVKYPRRFTWGTEPVPEPRPALVQTQAYGEIG